MGMFNSLTDHCKLVNNGKIDYYVIDRMDEVKAEMLRLLKVVDEICRDKGLKLDIKDSFPGMMTLISLC